MKIYIAARFTSKEIAKIVREALTALGHEVTSTWLDGDEPTTRETAEKDFRDIDRADALLFLSMNVDGAKGAYVEVGYALAKGKPVLVYPSIAPVISCVFMHHAGVQELSVLRKITDVVNVK